MSSSDIDSATTDQANDQATEAAEAAADPTIEADDPAGDEQPRGNREARYRRELRAAQADNAALSERLNTMQRNEVTRLAGAYLEDGVDIFREGLELGELLDTEGNVDAERIKAAAMELVASHRHWAKRGPAAPEASMVTGTDVIGKGGDAAPSWSDVLQGKVEQR